MKKKILLYTDTIQVGGAENHLLNLAKHIDKEKFQVALACSGSPTLNTWCSKFADANIPVFRLTAHHKHNPKQFLELKRIITREKIDLLHIHIWNPASGRYGFLAAKSSHIPFIYTEHDPFILSSGKEWLKKKLISGASSVIAISEKNKKLLQKNYPFLKTKIQTILNGIDTTWFDSQIIGFSQSTLERYREQEFDVSERNKKIGTELTTPIITTIAELHPRKGLLYLLEACKILAEKNINFKTILIGEGAQRKELEQFIEKNNLQLHVKLLGQRHDIPQLLKSSDIFVLPSLNEAFGLVLLEAMMAKLPIIATDNGGIPEIITNGKNGILVPPKNAQAIANAIEKLLSSPELVRKMSEQNQEDVRSTFDIKDMAKKTEEVYAELLQPQKTAEKI